MGVLAMQKSRSLIMRCMFWQLKYHGFTVHCTNTQMHTHLWSLQGEKRPTLNLKVANYSVAMPNCKQWKSCLQISFVADCSVLARHGNAFR